MALDSEGLPHTLDGLRQWIGEMDIEPDELIIDTIWHYEKENLTDPAYFWLPMDMVEKIKSGEVIVGKCSECGEYHETIDGQCPSCAWDKLTLLLL